MSLDPAGADADRSFTRTLAMGATTTAMLLLFEGALAAAPAPRFERQILPDIPLPGPLEVSVVKQARVTFAPGQASGAHLHPLPDIGTVTAGSFVFQIEGQEERILHIGDSFYEPAHVRILRFDNASAMEKASINAFYLARDAGDDTITMLAR